MMTLDTYLERLGLHKKTDTTRNPSEEIAEQLCAISEEDLGFLATGLPLGPEFFLAYLYHELKRSPGEITAMLVSPDSENKFTQYIAYKIDRLIQFYGIPFWEDIELILKTPMNESLNLTPMELRVLATVSRGYENNEISELFSISERTTKNHIYGNKRTNKGIYRKMGIRKDTQAIVLAKELGWLDSTDFQQHFGYLTFKEPILSLASEGFPENSGFMGVLNMLYKMRGYTNEQIALSREKSEYTIKNQNAKLYAILNTKYHCEIDGKRVVSAALRMHKEFFPREMIDNLQNEPSFEILVNQYPTLEQMRAYSAISVPHSSSITQPSL